MRFAPAVSAVRELVENSGERSVPVLVAIDGRCASGKTTLGDYLRGIFDCTLFHMDDFFLRTEQRSPERLAEPGGNVDYERFNETVLAPLLSGEQVFYQPFTCQGMKLLAGSYVQPRPLTLIEGSYSMHPYFHDPYDLRIFMDISPEDQMANILKRNGPEKAIDFRDKWIPMEEKYFKTYSPEKGALIIKWDL